MERGTGELGGFRGSEWFNVVTATAGDAAKCETDSGKQTELKD
jgi:hypothetical protein